MTPQEEKATHTLLYLLKYLHHLYEARFFNACFTENGAQSAVFDQEKDQRIFHLIEQAKADYRWLFDSTSLKLPPILNADPLFVEELIGMLEDHLAPEEAAHREPREYVRGPW